MNELQTSVCRIVNSLGSTPIKYTRVPAWVFAYGLIFCALSLSSSAQTFKGHQIGESTEEFLKVEPALRALLTDCQNSLPRRLTDDEVKKKFGQKAVVELHKRMAQDPNIGITDKDQDIYYDKCGGILVINSKGTGSIDGNGYDRSNSFHDNLLHRALAGEIVQTMQPIGDGREFSFQDGRLSTMKLSLSFADYKSVRDDVSKRLGTLPTESSIPYHNAYGATWSDPIAGWDTATLHVELTEKENPAKSLPPELWVQTQEAHQRSLAYDRQKKSPLDK